MKQPSKKALRAIQVAKAAQTKLWPAIRARNTSRRDAILLLREEGISLREIGKLLGITGQRVGALLRYWELRGIRELREGE